MSGTQETKEGTETRTERLRFWTRGEDLTRMARDLVLERRPDDALRFLVDGLEGMSWDMAVGVVTGTHKLIGRSPCTDADVAAGYHISITQDAGSSAYRAQVESMYRGLWKRGGDYYEPYAVVTSFGREDMGNGVQAGARALHYADDPEEDIVKLIELPGYATKCVNVLWRKVKERPPVWTWWTAWHVYAEDAMEDWLTRPEGPWGLEERGWSQRYYTAWKQQKEDEEATSAEREEEQEKRRKRREEEEDARAAEYERKEKAWAAEVRAQAADNGGFFDLTVAYPNGKSQTYSIPTRPFEVWALTCAKAQYLAPPWPTVCQSGLRLFGDCAEHSDWMLGAGIDYDRLRGLDRDEVLCDAITGEMLRVQKQHLRFEAAVLCGEGVSYGSVVHPKEDEEVPAGSIIVIPHAGEEYYIPAASCMKRGPQGPGAIITEAGGALSHLAVVGLEDGFRVVCVPGAREKYRPGARVSVDCSQGKVEVHRGMEI